MEPIRLIRRPAKGSLQSLISTILYDDQQESLSGFSGYIPSAQLSREQVERVAFDASIPEHLAKHFQHILGVADRMIAGKSDCLPGQRIAPWRILFILWADGLKIWID